MTQQESPFDNYPIEFKEINPEDFASFIVGEKTIITPNSEGYINQELQTNINLDEKNTTVINAGVGQGKTYSIIEIVKKYYDLEEYIIFIAPPYTSLIQQYYDSTINSGIPENQVYRYENIGTNLDIDPRTSRIQILTVNALLGNPGDNAILNSEAKRAYINTMVQYCRDSRKKVVFIYDEIHDAIHNFKEEYIFNLWKWRDVIHKNIIISATFNEASKIVIQHLANLTDKKIQLIESKRIRFPEKQSELYLHFNNKQKYNYDDENITNLVQLLISDGKEIDILCYSKKLVEDIYKNVEEGSIGILLRRQFGDIQKCTSDLIENQRPDREIPANRYNPTKCNVGTNFKTGISIEKENHAFIIIMPPAGAKDTFKNKYGIFSDGITSIIQAFARQRKKGEIHVILPNPKEFDFNSLSFTNDEYKESFKESYSSLQNISLNTTETKIKYIPLNSQNELLRLFYNNDYKKTVENEITYLSENRERLNNLNLNFPSLDKFILTHGEKYLVNKFPFFGGDLSTFITYSAITNQFINCKLKGISTKSPILLDQNSISTQLLNYFNSTITEETYFILKNYLPDISVYNELRDILFRNKIVMIRKNNDTVEEIAITDYNKKLEQGLLAVVQQYKYAHHQQTFDRSSYLIAKIAQAKELHHQNLTLNNDNQELTDAYLSMDYFREKVVSSIQATRIGRNDISYILNTPDSSFISESDFERFTTMVRTLSEKDLFISRDVYDFKRIFNRRETTNTDKINSFYNIIKKDFFKSRSRSINRSGLRYNIKEITEILEIPLHPMFTLNPISDAHFDSIPEYSFS